MRRLSRLATIAMLAITSITLGTGTALGCSCMPPDAEQLFNDSDGAFVGTLIESPSDDGAFVNSAEMVPYVFEVGTVYKGEIGSEVTVISAISGASCGLEMPEGSSASVFMWQEGGQWHSGLCSTMGPEALLDGPFEVIPMADTTDVGSEPETSVARWALLGIAGVAAAGFAVSRMRQRPESG